MNLENIGKNMQKIRNSLGWTQPQLAEKANISVGHLGHIERGANVMSMDCLLSLCDALGTTPNAILMGEYKEKRNGAADLLLRKLPELTEDEIMLLLEFVDVLSKLKINRV